MRLYQNRRWICTNYICGVLPHTKHNWKLQSFTLVHTGTRCSAGSSKDAYKAFYREKERERYLRKLDSALFLCNLDLKSEEIPLRDENTDIEQQTEDRLMIEKMYSCLRLLAPDDAEFIRMYFFQHVSRKELAKKYGVHPSNISRKAAKILEKLKKLMKK